MRRLVFTGDFVVKKEYDLSPELIDLFRDSYGIVNLEGPITDGKESISKTGPHLKLKASDVSHILSQLEIKLFCLANNHILDYGVSGIEDTLKFSSEHAVDCVGLHSNENRASYIKWIDNIVIINFCENEWSTFGHSITAKGYNPECIFGEIQRLSDHCDHLIVVYHGGNEYYDLPSPGLQRRLRTFIDCGADLVIAHHTHIVSGVEDWGNGRIYYGLGNFIFTRHGGESLGWSSGLIVEMSIDDNGQREYKEYYSYFDSSESRVYLQSSQMLQNTTSRFNDLSAIIRSEGSLEKEWLKYVQKEANNIEWQLAPLFALNNKFLRKLFYILRIKGLTRSYKKTIFNYSRCESLSEITQAVLAKKTEK